MSVEALPQSVAPLTRPQSLPDGGLALGESRPQSDGIPFASQLQDALRTHEAHAWMADQKAAAFAAGSLDDIHGTMIALKQADIELRVIANVRNKLLDAFNDLLHMSV